MSAGRFYVVRGGIAYFGPGVPSPNQAQATNIAQIPFRNTRQRNGMIFDQLLGRAAKFPGVLFVERPAHCRIVFPTAASITDHSTLQLVDPDPGESSKYVFEFKKAGPITLGNVEVDISAAVTGADVAAAFIAALNGYNLTVPVSAPSGFVGERLSSSLDTIDFLQAFARKNALIPVAGRGTWTAKTWGSWGNTPPVVSVAGEWTNRITGFSGGKKRHGGVVAIPESGAKPWAQAIRLFVPDLTPPVELG